jgi:hypothetical protein
MIGTMQWVHQITKSWGLIIYYTILSILPHICFCLCCPLADDEQPHEQHVCHVTHQTLGHIHSHTFKHGMDVSHGSMADMNLQIVLRHTCVILSLLTCLWWSCMPHATHQNMRDIHAHVFPILGWMSHMLPWLPWLMLVMCSIKTSNSSMVQV